MEQRHAGERMVVAGRGGAKVLDGVSWSIHGILNTGNGISLLSAWASWFSVCFPYELQRFPLKGRHTSKRT